MGALIAVLVFLIVLAHVGRLGPFVWAGRTRFGASASPQQRAVAAPDRPEPERVLALRLAEGELSPDDYLERLSLLQSH